MIPQALPGGTHKYRAKSTSRALPVVAPKHKQNKQQSVCVYICTVYTHIYTYIYQIYMRKRKENHLRSDMIKLTTVLSCILTYYTKELLNKDIKLRPNETKLEKTCSQGQKIKNKINTPHV